MTKKKKSSSHYINNEKFFKEITEWKKNVNEARESEDSIPPITSYIGECFLEIATNLAKKPNFVNYPFKDEMIGDAVENCILYCENFDAEKSQNPFSYFTQITYFAFLRRIQKEKKQNYVKYKYLQTMNVDGNLSDYLRQMGISEEEAESYKKIDATESSKNKKKKKKTDMFEE